MPTLAAGQSAMLNRWVGHGQPRVPTPVVLLRPFGRLWLVQERGRGCAYPVDPDDLRPYMPRQRVDVRLNERQANVMRVTGTR
jgi:hypothetical protein